MGIPQLRSRLLLLALFALCACSSVARGCLERERRALLQLRDSFFYPGGFNLSQWRPNWAGDDCCRWGGVTCGRRAPRRVVSLSLNVQREKRLGGWAVNGSLFAALAELQQLELAENQISGWIEQQGMLGLKKLQTVDLRENLLTDEGVSWILRLPSLVQVDLSYNKLRRSSTLQGLCGQKSLATLKLQQNMIEGTIDCIGDMVSVEELWLQGNRLSGEIPPLRKLTSLKYLVLGQNRLSGVFYISSLAGHKNFTVLMLYDNRGLEVETELPSGWTPAFQLRGLALSGCVVNRRSGGRIPSFLAGQNDIFTLALSRTSIRGTIPSWMFDNVGDTLLLDGNRLSGPLPRLQGNKTRGLSLVDLSHNRIEGPLPPEMATALPTLYHLNLSWNAFQGSMDSFGQLGYLGVLDASHNGLTGEIPSRLTTEGSRLRHLRLSHNHLEGRMLPAGSNMKFLKYLVLENNRLTGVISADLANSTSLIILNLRGNRLSGDMPPQLFALPDLAAVLLSGNRFHGQIPPPICRMPGLRMLDLSANSFSGAIPRCLSNVTSWTKNSTAAIDQNYYALESVEVEFWTKGERRILQGDELSLFTGIDLSRNQLSGAIPAQVAAMAALRSLNVSRNHINGAIPASFGGLELIESLDLSHNELSGSIPPQMASLRHLAVFCVAGNKITGSNPFGGRLSELSKMCS